MLVLHCNWRPMNRSALFCLSALSFCCSASLLAAESEICTEAFEDRPIAKLELIVENLPANASFDPKVTLNRLNSKVGDPFSQLTFDGDLKTLSEEYDRVEPRVEVQNGEVYIQLRLYMRSSIRSIEWEGNTHITTKTLRKELGIKPGSIFNRQAFNKAFQKLKELYVKKGYFESQLYYSVVPDAKTNEVAITVHIQEGRSGQIDEILFTGFSDDEKSELLGMVHTKKYNLFTSWITGTGTYNEEMLEQDRLTIIQFLQNRGYADAKVTIDIREAPHAGKIILAITAERGAVYHLDRLTFKGNTLFSNEQIDNAFLCRPGDIYSPEKLRTTSQSIKDLYGRKGYIDCNVQYEAQLVANEPLYNIVFSIDEGKEYKIGLVRIFGNSQTKNHVILRESLLVPGETFDSAKLKATQTRLENIGYFKSVNVYAVRTQDDQELGENYRDVYIEVDETTTGNINLFFGVSSADSIFGGLDLSENNFNYKGFSKIFSQGLSALRGGGEYAHARASLGAKQQTYSISWLTPYFRDSLWRVGFDITRSENGLVSDDYQMNSIGGTLFASYPLNYYWSVGTKYRIKNSINHVKKDTPREERKEASNSGLVTGLGGSITFDSTDSALKPHNGFRSTAEAEFAGFTGTKGGYTFLRLGYINSYYTQLWRRGIMKYRFECRYIDPISNKSNVQDFPMSERFFLGGENSVRGYKAFDLGPHYLGKKPEPGDKDYDPSKKEQRRKTGDPKGGLSSTLLSVEYLQEVLPVLDLFVFADAGSIAMQTFYLANFRLSWGFGARIEVLNRVPIILGVGFPVNPLPHSRSGEVKNFYFSMGGQF